MEKYKIGYTQGTYDLFHVGHLNLLENAKKQCEYLIVGVNSDRLVLKYKNVVPKTDETGRARIICSLKFVDKVFIVNTLDKVNIYDKIHFDCIFIGDDWKGNERWIQTEKDLAKYKIPVIYLPHTDGISSTQLRNNYVEYEKAEKIDE